MGQIDLVRIVTGIETELDGQIELSFASESTTVRWIGRKIIPNGWPSWFEVGHQGQKHYFTANTGATILGSKRKTQEIYHALSNYSVRGPR